MMSKHRVFKFYRPTYELSGCGPLLSRNIQNNKYSMTRVHYTETPSYAWAPLVVECVSISPQFYFEKYTNINKEFTQRFLINISVICLKYFAWIFRFKTFRWNIEKWVFFLSPSVLRLWFSSIICLTSSCSVRLLIVFWTTVSGIAKNRSGRSYRPSSIVV